MDNPVRATSIQEVDLEPAQLDDDLRSRVDNPEDDSFTQ